MPFNSIKDPGIKQGFSILADAFVPNVGGLIEADLNAKRRDQIIAATAGQNLKNKQVQGYIDSGNQAQALIASNPDFAVSGNRANLMSVLLGMEDGMQHGPKFAMGATGFVQPNALSDEEFARALQATGLVNDYANTQSGFEADLAAELDREMRLQTAKTEEAYELQRMKDAAELERLKYETANPHPRFSRYLGQSALVNGKTSDELYDAFSEQAGYRHSDVDFHNTNQVAPDVTGDIRRKLADEYQLTRSVEAAVQNVLDGVTPQEASGVLPSWVPFFGGTDAKVTRQDLAWNKNAGPSAGAQAGSAGTVGSGAPAAPAAPAAPEATSIPVPAGLQAKEGETFKLKSTGQVFRRVGERLELVQ